jgi:transcriptional regulator with XRE-family HTH domain
MVARRIQALRHERALILSELAKKSRMSKGHLSNIERGLVVVDIRTIDKLARGLGVRLLDLLTFPEQDRTQRFIDAVRHASLEALIALEQVLERFSPPTKVTPQKTTHKRRTRPRRLCHDCTNEALPGQSRCQLHRDKAQLADRQRYARYRAENRCGHCGDSALEGTAACARHTKRKDRPRASRRLSSP